MGSRRFSRSWDEELPTGQVVYIVRAGNSRFVKIGHSSDLRQRLKDIQAANPGKLALLLTLPGNDSLERSLHNQFRHARVRNEWFRLTDEIREFIDANGGRGNSLLVKARRLPAPTFDDVRAALDAARLPAAKLT